MTRSDQQPIKKQKLIGTVTLLLNRKSYEKNYCEQARLFMKEKFGIFSGRKVA